MSITDEPASQDRPVLLRIYLRGGQVIEKLVTDWSVRTSPIDGQLVAFTWSGVDDSALMPWVRCDAIDAITRHEAPSS